MRLNNTFKATIFVAFFFLGLSKTFTQVYENANSEVYNIAYRFAQKGIVDWNDISLPIDRHSFKKALEKIKNNSSKLSVIEKKEVDFYLAEYQDEFLLVDSLKERSSFINKDKSGRFRLFKAKNATISMYLDPIAGFNNASFSDNKNTLQYFNGIRFWGYMGKNKKLGYNFSFRNVVERGDSLDPKRSFSTIQGITNISVNPTQDVTFAEFYANINYSFNKGFVSFGRDNINWGYGEFGKPILSSKSPSYTNIRLQYSPFKWLQLDYFHAWLNSNIVDSNLSYTNQGYFREVLTPKFLASHSFTFYPAKGLSLSIGESMVISDRFDIGYLIPINFFKTYDMYVSSYRLPAGSNNQFFAQISSRNHIKNTHVYVSLFIDEIRIATLLNKTKERNQVAYNIGFNTTDFLVNYLSLGAEYTKVRGGVYNNIVSAQTYTNTGSLLGDWMGQNSDRIGAFVKFTPRARVKLNTWMYHIRKGKDLTITQQYDNNPTTPFLHELLFKQTNIGFSAMYELVHTLKLRASVENSQRFYNQSNTKTSISTFSFGCSYGF